MRKAIDWVAIEGVYRAGKESVLGIANAYGISEAAIRKKAKQHGWIRDPEGTKRQMVRAAMAGSTNKSAKSAPAGITDAGTAAAAHTMEEEAAQDIADMRAGLEVARLCIRRLRDALEDTTDAKEIKTIAEANRISVETIRRIRGLDEAGESEIVISNKRSFDA